MKFVRILFSITRWHLLFATILLIGCATAPERNEALERARASYAEAQSDPKVAQKAEVALYEASVALKEAEQAKDAERMAHLAYLAERKAETAKAEAARRDAEEAISQLSKEKDQILLQSRELETKRAIGLAESRAREAEAARQQSETRAREIERLKGEADALAAQAEQARTAAEARAVEIDKARSEAEAKALEAEVARQQAEARALEVQRAQKEAEARALEAQTERTKASQELGKRKEIERELEELKAKKTERGAVLTLGDILFEVGKNRLLPGAMMTIDKLASFLNRHPERNVTIEGHTDSVGSDEYNQWLSKRRADAVKEALLTKGIASERIATKGYGEQFPVASNTTPAGRQQNRRVEVIILEEGANPEQMTR